MKKTTVIESISIIYVILFLYTGISKLIGYSVFKEQIATSPILADVAKPLAVTVPFIEFTTVVLLIIPRWRLKGLYTAAGMMTLFTAYIIGIISFSEELPCSCGGIISELSWHGHIVLNCTLILMATIAIILEKKVERTNQQRFASIVQV